MIRTVVIGAGRIARRHYLAALMADTVTDLVGVWDLDVSAAQDAVRELPEAGSVAVPALGQGIGPFLEEVEPDLVVNLTSHAAHYSVTRNALVNGYSVYTEKPLARTYNEALELATLAAENDVGLWAAPYINGAPLIGACRRLLESGEIGFLHSVYARYSCSASVQINGNTSAEVRRGGGVLVDLAVYPLAVLDALLGPADFTMCARTFAEQGETDVVEAWSLGLQFGGGAHAVVQSASHAHHDGFRLYLRLMGTHGDAVVDSGNLFSTSLSVSSRNEVNWHDVGVEASNYRLVDGPLHFARELRAGRRQRNVASALRLVDIIERAHGTVPVLRGGS